MADAVDPTSPMTPDDRLKAAWSELTLVLGFFPRIDTKLSVVLGLDLGMLALLAARLPAPRDVTWPQILLGLVFLAILSRSLYGLWRGAFPDLRGGTNSLVYFNSIQAMAESSFLKSFGALSAGQLADEVLSQAWCNSRILVIKFKSLRIAYVWMLAATVVGAALIFLLPEPAISQAVPAR